MKVVYEPRVDVATIYFLPDGSQSDVHTVDDEIFIHLTHDGRLTAIEIVGASERLDVNLLKRATYHEVRGEPIRLEAPPR